MAFWGRESLIFHSCQYYRKHLSSIHPTYPPIIYLSSTEYSQDCFKTDLYLSSQCPRHRPFYWNPALCAVGMRIIICPSFADSVRWPELSSVAHQCGLQTREREEAAVLILCEGYPGKPPALGDGVGRADHGLREFEWAGSECLWVCVCEHEMCASPPPPRPTRVHGHGAGAAQPLRWDLLCVQLSF